MTQDPIGHEGGLNLYSYCDNNPLAKVDPDGKVPEWWLNLGTWVDDAFLGGGIAGAGDAWGRWESGTGSGWTVVTNFVWAGLNGASNFVSGGSSGAIRGAGSTIGRNIASRTTVKVASNYAVVKAGLKLIGKIKQHHLFPKEFARKFAELGIKINEHIVNVDQSLHKLLHEKGGGELWKQSWNRQWENFFRSNRNAGKDDAMKFMMQMRKKFGI